MNSQTAPQPMEQLTGAYYAPVADPSKKHRFHHYTTTSRGGGCCCCNPCTCLLGCLCTCVCQIIIAIIAVLGVVALILWAIFRPNIIRFHASQAALSEFNLSENDNNTLHYNLALNLTIRNPNRRLAFNYDQIEANAYYRGERFSTVNLATFKQGTKSTAHVTAVFKGQQVVVLGEKKVRKYHDDKKDGAFDIDVRINIKMRTKVWFVRLGTMRPKVHCDLTVPLTSNGAVSKAYEPKGCRSLWG